MIIVQTITTIWTKRSRGAPAATERARTPEACLLPEVPSAAPVLLHSVRFLESQTFRADPSCWEPIAPAGQGRSHALEPYQGWAALETLPLITRGLRIAFDGELVTAERLPEAIPGWPERDHGQLLAVRPSTWSQLIWNRRHAGSSTGHGEWTYSKVVLNLANQLGASGDPFRTTAPQRVLDQQTDLA